MSYEHYHAVIVGSGPAGLGAAWQLKDDRLFASRTLILEKGRNIEERLCAVREGKSCQNCQPCNIKSGLGGAGPFTDGKICLYEQDLRDLFVQNQNGYEDGSIDKKISNYLEVIRKIWRDHGVDDYKDITNKDEEMELLKSEAIQENIEFIPYPVLHIGSDGAKKVIKSLMDTIKNKGIQIESRSNVINVEKNDDLFYITYYKLLDNKTETITVTSNFIVLALGREMQNNTYIKQLVRNININFSQNNLEIGCRVEMPYQIMDKFIDITYDPKFIMLTPTYEDYVRTFCTCHKGRVVREGSYVNGHVDKKSLTKNTNFALLVRNPLDELELEDAMEHGRKIADLVLSQGRGKPLVQRLGDLKKGTPTTAETLNKSIVKTTLRRQRAVVPGDISSCYSSRIITDILEGLEKLDKIIKGVNNDSNLIYAPEIKPTCKINLKEGVKTEESNFYICGDFSGYTRGITQAMIMGIMVGEDIMNEVKKGFQLKL